MTPIQDHYPQVACAPAVLAAEVTRIAGKIGKHADMQEHAERLHAVAEALMAQAAALSRTVANTAPAVWRVTCGDGLWGYFSNEDLARSAAMNSAQENPGTHVGVEPLWLFPAREPASDPPPFVQPPHGSTLCLSDVRRVLDAATAAITAWGDPIPSLSATYEILRQVEILTGRALVLKGAPAANPETPDANT
jgi:hypothetical protein